MKRVVEYFKKKDTEKKDKKEKWYLVSIKGKRIYSVWDDITDQHEISFTESFFRFSIDLPFNYTELDEWEGWKYTNCFVRRFMNQREIM